ncbi:MAG: Zn-dependent hydrolase, partial [Pontibacter sp.]|nr:Zn-dependent hydrolase [Pontibacter sp.]
DMKNNKIDVVIGPIETYEDKLFGYKAAHEAYVLVKDMEWSKRLAKYAAFLPELQRGLPVPAKYKKETPGTDSDLNAYDVVFYAGDSNAGSKTIAINLPNDEEVQLKKGTRRLQLKNAMRAKFDKIMVPIAEELIVEEQRKNVTFDAFFANTMFHEVAHGLGIKNTVNNKGTVREALKEHASALEEGKADILGLYMITQLQEKGELEGDLKDYYTTFLAGIFRSVRFGAASAHGKANMVRFNFFKENGAFERDEQTGKYRVNYEKMREAMNKLSEKILTLQGEGDYAGVGNLLNNQGQVSPQLQADLDKLAKANIPVDIVFEQGVDVLGLK